MKYIFYIPIFLLLFFAFSVFYKSDSSFDQDLGRHLKLGEIIVNTKQVPPVNLFSYTSPDFTFINHHFLFEVFIYLWSTVLNLQSLLIFKIIIILFSVFLLLSTVKKSNYPLLLPLGYIFLHVLRERTDLRPEIFSFFFTSLTFFILEKFTSKEKTKFLFLLPLIQLLWVNAHIYFFLGLVLQIFYTVDFYFQKEYRKCKTLLLILLVSISLSLLNPNFMNGLFYPLRIFDNYGYSIAENQNIFLLESIGFSDNNFLFVKISSFIIIFSIIISLLKNIFSLKNILISLTGLILALTSIRSFPYLFFLCFPIVLQNFNVQKFNKKILFLTTILGIFLIIESVLYLNAGYYKNTNSSYEPKLILKENVKEAMDFVLANNLPQPIYNNFDIGSYIIYRGYPKYRVFIDGRPEAYPASFFENIYKPSQLDPEIFKQLDYQYNFQTIIFSITDQTPWGKSFLVLITKNPDWSVVYFDKFMIILLKNNHLQQYRLKPVILNQLNPDSYSYTDHKSYVQMSLFLINTGHINSAKKFAQKAWEITPDNEMTKALLLYTLGQSSNSSDRELMFKLNMPASFNMWW